MPTSAGDQGLFRLATIPQLYVKGEFVGGCDIVTEMTLSGELDKLFDDHGIAYSKDAAEKIRAANA